MRFLPFWIEAFSIHHLFSSLLLVWYWLINTPLCLNQHGLHDLNDQWQNLYICLEDGLMQVCWIQSTRQFLAAMIHYVILLWFDVTDMKISFMMSSYCNESDCHTKSRSMNSRLFSWKLWFWIFSWLWLLVEYLLVQWVDKMQAHEKYFSWILYFLHNRWVYERMIVINDKRVIDKLQQCNVIEN